MNPLLLPLAALLALIPTVRNRLNAVPDHQDFPRGALRHSLNYCIAVLSLHRQELDRGKLLPSFPVDLKAVADILWRDVAAITWLISGVPESPEGQLLAGYREIEHRARELYRESQPPVPTPTAPFPLDPRRNVANAKP